MRKNSVTVANDARAFFLELVILGTWIREDMVQNLYSDQPKGDRDKTAESVLLNF